MKMGGTKLLIFFLLVNYSLGEPPEKLGQECSISSYGEGKCLKKEDCEYIRGLKSKFSTLSPEKRELVKQSQEECLSSEGKYEKLFCCIKDPEIDVTVRSGMVPKMNCEDGNGQQGVCISYTNCRKINDIYVRYKQGRHKKIEKTFLQKSVCGKIDGVTQVCCAPEVEETTTELETFSTKKSTTPVTSTKKVTTSTKTTTTAKPPTIKPSLLPRFPVCGLGNVTVNKIFGGNKTMPKEYPWTVPLYYKCKISSLL